MSEERLKYYDTPAVFKTKNPNREGKNVIFLRGSLEKQEQGQIHSDQIYEFLPNVYYERSKNVICSIDEVSYIRGYSGHDY